MKVSTILFIALVSGLAQAKVNLKMDYSFQSKSKNIAVSKEMNLDLNKSVLVDLPGQKEKLEINITNKVPKELNKQSKVSNAVVVNMRLLDFSSGEEVVLASPKVMTVYGSTAEMESTNDKDEKMRLVLTPNRL